MSLKTVYDSCKTWLKSLVIPIVVGIILHNTDIAKIPFSKFYPDEDSIGGVAFPLAQIPRGDAQRSRLEVVIVRQSIKPLTKINFFRRGTSDGMSTIFAGLAANSPGRATPLTGGLNGMSFLELDVPARTLGGTTVIFRSDQVAPARYVVTSGDVSKDLADPEDLVVQTKNEVRQMHVLYGFILLSLIAATFLVTRSQPLRHPSDENTDESQWV